MQYERITIWLKPAQKKWVLKEGKASEKVRSLVSLAMVATTIAKQPKNK